MTTDRLHTLGGIWVWHPQWPLTAYILLGVYGCDTHNDHWPLTYSWGYTGVTPTMTTDRLHTLGGIRVWHPQWPLTAYILLGVYGCDTHNDHWPLTYSWGYMGVTPTMTTDRLHTLGGIRVWHPQWPLTAYILLGVYGCDTHSDHWQITYSWGYMGVTPTMTTDRLHTLGGIRVWHPQWPLTAYILLGVYGCDTHNDHWPLTYSWGYMGVTPTMTTDRLHTLGGIWVWHPQWPLTAYILLGVYGCDTHSDHWPLTYSWGYMGVTPTMTTDRLHTLGGIWVWHPQWSVTTYILLGVYGCDTHSDHWPLTYSCGYMGVTPTVITDRLHTTGGIWVWHPQWPLTDYILLGVYGCYLCMGVTPTVTTDRLHTIGGICVRHPQSSLTVLVVVHGCNTHSNRWDSLHTLQGKCDTHSNHWHSLRNCGGMIQMVLGAAPTILFSCWRQSRRISISSFSRASASFCSRLISSCTETAASLNNKNSN